jgi:ADP-heptose:LPS heptosyltransferase
MKLKFYALIAWLWGTFSIWRRSSSEGGRLLRATLNAIGSKNYVELNRLFWGEVLIPNYRLKALVTLGRPSPTVHRKFAKLLVSSNDIAESHASNQIDPKFLIIRNGALGDVLMTTPMVRGLYESHDGKISIDIATFYPDVFNNSPYIKKTLNPKFLNRGIHDYDHVINLNGVYERAPAVHPVNAYAKVALGSQIYNRRLDLFSSKDDEKYMSEAIANIGRPYFVLHHLHHEWPNRNISEDVWLYIVEAIAKHRGIKLIFIGSRQQSHAHTGEFSEDHRDKYTVQQLGILMKMSLGFIGADSAPAHIAATTDVPISVFYTCAHHEVRMPLRSHGEFLPLYPNIDCYGCLIDSPMKNASYYCKRGDNACVTTEYLTGNREKIIYFVDSCVDRFNLVNTPSNHTNTSGLTIRPFS